MRKEKKKEPLPNTTTKFDAKLWLEWTYERKEGDLTIYSPSREDAAERLKELGYEINAEKLVVRDRSLANALQPIDAGLNTK